MSDSWVLGVDSAITAEFVRSRAPAPVVRQLDERSPCSGWCRAPSGGKGSIRFEGTDLLARSEDRIRDVPAQAWSCHGAIGQARSARRTASSARSMTLR